jgi:acetylornithine/succinyldiaminopimelate/putrescine aminotransferase
MAHPAEMRAQPPRIIMKGEGVHVTDIDGRTVLDAVGGLWNVNLGYSCDPIKKAIADQLDALPYYSGFRGASTGPSIELAYELTEWLALQRWPRPGVSSSTKMLPRAARTSRTLLHSLKSGIPASATCAARD